MSRTVILNRVSLYTFVAMLLTELPFGYANFAYTTLWGTWAVFSILFIVRDISMQHYFGCPDK